MTSRRTFLCKIIPIAAVMSIFASRISYANALLGSQDPHAIAMDYVANSSLADNTKHPKHNATQKCKNCHLYQGLENDKSASCPVFPGKLVNANGWCKAYIRKN